MGAQTAPGRGRRELAGTPDERAHLSRGLDAAATNDTGIYPLVAPGERFPYNDASKEPVLPPRDGDRASVLADLLVGIADVERLGYLSLKEWGASPLKAVATAGGGVTGAGLWWAAQLVRLALLEYGAEDELGAALEHDVAVPRP